MIVIKTNAIDKVKSSVTYNTFDADLYSKRQVRLVSHPPYGGYGIERVVRSLI